MAIELPKDASGACVRLNTTTMYREDGTQFHVSDLFFEVKPYKWFARNGSECIEVGKLYLTPPDSWKKLLKDLDRSAGDNVIFARCTYFETYDCTKCCHFCRGDCAKAMLKDIADRIRKLRGED